jgi:hypothetical protein
MLALIDKVLAFLLRHMELTSLGDPRRCSENSTALTCQGSKVEEDRIKIRQSIYRGLNNVLGVLVENIVSVSIIPRNSFYGAGFGVLVFKQISNPTFYLA